MNSRFRTVFISRARKKELLNVFFSHVLASFFSSNLSFVITKCSTYSQMLSFFFVHLLWHHITLIRDLFLLFHHQVENYKKSSYFGLVFSFFFSAFSKNSRRQPHRNEFFFILWFFFLFSLAFFLSFMWLVSCYMA